MIKHPQAQYFGGFNQLLVDFQVTVAGLEFAGRVIVSKNHGGGSVGDHIGKDLSGMDLAFVQKTDGHDSFFNYLIGPVERDTDKILLLLVSDIADQRQYILGFRNSDGLLDDMPPCQFKTCQKLGRLCQ